MYFTALGGAFVLRATARAVWRGLVPPSARVVLGTGQLAAQVIRKLALEPGHHLVLREQPDHSQSPNGHSTDTITREAVEAVIRETQVDRVIVAMPELDEATLARVVSACRALGRQAERGAADAGHARHRRAAHPHRRDAGDRVPHLEHVVLDHGPQASARLRGLRARPGAARPAHARGGRADPPRLARARRCSASRAPDGTATPSGCSSSARCATTPRPGSPRCCPSTS